MPFTQSDLTWVVFLLFSHWCVFPVCKLCTCWCDSPFSVPAAWLPICLQPCHPSTQQPSSIKPQFFINIYPDCSSSSWCTSPDLPALSATLKCVFWVFPSCFNWEPTTVSSSLRIIPFARLTLSLPHSPILLTSTMPHSFQWVSCLPQSPSSPISSSAYIPCSAQPCHQQLPFSPTFTPGTLTYPFHEILLK